MPTILLLSLLLTLLFELPFALAWGVRKRGLVLVILMNLLTNPAVVTLHYLTGLTLIWELAAVVTEGFCCRGMIRKPWLFALLINTFSYSMGELLQFVLRRCF